MLSRDKGNTCLQKKKKKEKKQYQEEGCVCVL